MTEFDLSERCIMRDCGAPATGEFVASRRGSLQRRLFTCDRCREQHVELARYYEWVPMVPTAAVAERLERMARGYFG